MPEIQVITETVKQTEEVSAVKLPMDMFAAEDAAKRNLIDTVEQKGWDIYKLQETEQENSAKMDYEARYRDFQLELQKDTDYAGHKTKFESWYDKNSGDILGKVSNTLAKRKMEDYFELSKSRDGARIETQAWDDRAAEVGQKIPTEIDNHIATIINKQGPEKAEAIDSMNGYLAGLREAGLLDGKGHEYWKRISANQLEKAEKNIIIEQEKAQVKQILEFAVGFRDEDGKINLKMAQEFIKLSDIPVDKQLEVMKKVADWDEQEAINNENAWQVIEGEKSGEWQKLLQAQDFKALKDAAEDFNSGMEGEYLTKETALKQKWIRYADEGLKGEDIISDPAVRSRIFTDITDMATGKKSREQMQEEINNARYIDKTLNQKDFEDAEKLLNQKYVSKYATETTQVKEYMRGLLLNPDSMGYIKHAPVRYKIHGDAMADYLEQIANQEKSLKPGEAYELGRTIAAMHQVSEQEAERLEIEMNIGLKTKEKENVPLGRSDDVQRGELGELSRPGGGVSTEISITTELSPGQWVNIPLLVIGQVGVKDLLAGKKWTRKQEKIAIARAKKREEAGGNLERFPSVDAALETVHKLTAEDKIPYNRRTKKKRKVLTAQIARKYLDIAGGDRKQAKILAAEDGYKE